ncbi:recombinase family protein [Geobacter sp. AOG1]|uniref:recombinase family protein n=1 Tax=Geobacter sp. AOG1 TaxID=1566346 RepID=UPI001CC3B87D|nr:recombinase family protein [Geobacter sp. AOG1]GFE56739.1 serine recombinase [Geobacter sp. AOG1]
MAHQRRTQPAIGAVRKEKLAVSYIRVSTQSQEDKYSLDAQRYTLDSYAASKGIKVVREFVEIASARTTGRDHFNDMVTLLRNEKKKPADKRIDIILVEKVDRLTRNHYDKEKIVGLGIELHLAKHNKVFNKTLSSEQRRDLDDQVTIASHQTWNLGEESSKGMRAKAAKGIYPSNAPFGYRNVTRADDVKVITPDPVTAPIVARAFIEYAGGIHSMSTLVEKINVELREAGVSRKLSKSSVADMLKNPIYCGEFDWSGQRYKGIHASIVTRELYEKANGIAADNNRHRPRIDKTPWLYQGIIKCGHCGCAVVAERKKGIYTYYHCTGNKGNDCPGKKSVREEVIESAVLAQLDALRIDEESLKNFISVVIRYQHEAKVKHQMQLERLHEELTTNKDRQNAHYMRLLDGKIDQTRFDAIQKDLESSQHHLEEKIYLHSRLSHLFLENPEQLRQLLKQAVSSYKTQPVNEKRRLLQYLLAGGTLVNGTMELELRRPFDALVPKKAA